ncbi:MAG: two-component system, OmpR family, alkaline phosphatase synthesis response regulator PhoP [Candidatus Eremiobacteraeota bacterium]|jgi:DNA-binding response OmpR family regulator|nr:two-component system, OmpR family, alkaline phosphatase synthesis response regulator PhoP [Candidatus Eremiobacteraeota bacterium]
MSRPRYTGLPVNRAPPEPRVLVIDGQPEAVEGLISYLNDDGYEVVCAVDGEEGLRLATETEPDLVVMDLILPKRSGLEVARSIRARSDVPIVVITARASETDCVVALELGADDYITKPFSPREVVARIAAIFRRTTCTCGAVRTNRLSVPSSNLEIDRASYQAWLGGKRLPLTPTEFRILDALAQHQGQILTRAQLLDCVASDGDVYDRTLDKHIANLRKKIERDPARPHFVITVFGVGYMYGA